MTKYALKISRSLIALLFVVAGVQKLMNFAVTSSFIASLGIPIAPGVTAIVIFIEIVVALMFAHGYKVCINGWILIAFTALVTIIVHHDFAVGSNLVMTFKNIAIIGGILAAIQACTCGTCPPSRKREH